MAGVTGACGLVYEVAWQKYLAILLGAQSEASAAVLALFLGGLSTGYALFGRVATRVVGDAGDHLAPRQLLRVYGACEIGIGLLAWSFPWLFGLLRSASALIPTLPAAFAFALDVCLAAMLVLPPAVLMGSTVPLLTQALSRDLREATKVHASVYGLNTLGGFAGAIAGGFVLVPRLGLDGTLWLLGAVNLAAGLGYLLLGRGMPGWSGSPLVAAADVASRSRPLLTAALLFGFALMSMQTVLLRLGAMSFGASHFTFAMVVAVFVLCLAVGSLVVSRFGSIPPRAVVAVPWALVLCTLLLHPLLDDAPYWVHVVRTWFRNTDAAFFPYQVTCAALLLAVLALPLGLAGATLPLLFHFLRSERGELGHAAGGLYAANTVGSVLGALLGGYLLLFWIDLDEVFRVAVGSIALGAALIGFRVLPGAGWSWLALPALASILLLPAWRPERLASGLFRYREPTPASYSGPAAFFASPRQRMEIVHYEDGPVASVAVHEEMRGNVRDRSILVNGKSDGMLIDEYITMALVGILPALFSEGTEHAFVVGYGTGTTAGELASLDSMRRVDVVEISGAALRAAPLFDYGNLGASTHPRVRLHRGDAYRELIRSDQTYDVIASEPSNPWVTGTEMLFSREFLETARTKLAPGGVYAQWIHAYESDDATLELVLRTFAEVFPHVSLWYMQDVDLLLLGFESEAQALDLERLLERAARPDFATALERAGVAGAPGLLAHEILPVGALHATLGSGPVHTLTHPLLSHRAARAFFRDDVAHLPRALRPEARAIADRNALLGRYLGLLDDPDPETLAPALLADACAGHRPQCALLFAWWALLRPESETRRTLLTRYRADPRLAPVLGPQTLRQMTAFLRGKGHPSGPVLPARALAGSELFARTYLHAIPYPLDGLADLWSRCEDAKPQPLRCDEGRARVEKILGPLPRISGRGGAAPPPR